MSDLMDKSKTATPSGTRGTPTTPGTDLEWDAMIPGQKPTGGAVRIARLVRAGNRQFTQQAPGHLVATEQVFEPRGSVGHAFELVRRTVIEARIPNELEILERVSTVKGLAVFASDNISSSAWPNSAWAPGW